VKSVELMRRSQQDTDRLMYAAIWMAGLAWEQQHHPHDLNLPAASGSGCPCRATQRGMRLAYESRADVRYGKATQPQEACSLVLRRPMVDDHPHPMSSTLTGHQSLCVARRA
jgi:hypothetical protein